MFFGAETVYGLWHDFQNEAAVQQTHCCRVLVHLFWFPHVGAQQELAIGVGVAHQVELVAQGPALVGVPVEVVGRDELTRVCAGSKRNEHCD